MKKKKCKCIPYPPGHLETSLCPIHKDSRLKCIHAKEIKDGDIKCRLYSTHEEIEYCDYGKGICKDYEEIVKK